MGEFYKLIYKKNDGSKTYITIIYIPFYDKETELPFSLYMSMAEDIIEDDLVLMGESIFKNGFKDC